MDSEMFDFEGDGQRPKPGLVVELTKDELTVFLRPISIRKGGHQNFLRVLHRRLTDVGTLSLNEKELRRVQRYTNGAGGHQDRFQAVLSAAWRAGWNKP